MNDSTNILRGTLVSADNALSMPSTVWPALPALAVTEAAVILAEEPSMPLATALRQAAKLEEPPTTYLAQNGDKVTLRRDPIEAGEDLIGEARRRIAAINTILATRAAPKHIVQWLYRLVQLVEKPPVGDQMDESVRA